MVKVERFKSFVSSQFDGMWYASLTTDGITYLHPDKTWRRSTQDAEGNYSGFFPTKEEIVALLEEMGCECEVVE